MAVIPAQGGDRWERLASPQLSGADLFPGGCRQAAVRPRVAQTEVGRVVAHPCHGRRLSIAVVHGRPFIPYTYDGPQELNACHHKIDVIDEIRSKWLVFADDTLPSQATAPPNRPS